MFYHWHSSKMNDLVLQNSGKLHYLRVQPRQFSLVVEKFDEKVSDVGFVFDTGEEFFGPSVKGTRILTKVADVEDRLGIR